MKKLLLVIAALVFAVGLAIPKSAEAVIFEISNPIFGGVVYSPQSTFTIGDTTYANVAPSGTVTIGAPRNEGDSQPQGIYGAGVPLAGLGLVDRYDLYFATNFTTYDAAGIDDFMAVVTKGNYLWGGGTVIGGYQWGGANFPGIEYGFGGWGNQSTVAVTPSSDYYFNIVLRTTIDTMYPSWGTFGDVGVGVIPEPTSMMLLGMGILGLFGLKRRKA